MQITKPKTYAGGLPAIVSALRFLFGSMGFWRAMRGMLRLNQKDGFDCPGCAWPDPDDERTSFEFCENGAKALAEEGTRKKIGGDFFSSKPLVGLQGWDEFELGQLGRLTEPVYRGKGEDRYRPISWDQGLDLVAQRLRGADPNRCAFYTSGRTSNEAAFLYQLLVRRHGSNNLPDCSNLCHESSGMAMKASLGIGKGTVRLEDFTKADLILILGQNPGTNHPRMLSSLKDAKKAGSRIITINPLREAGSRAFRHPQHPMDMVGAPVALEDLHLPVRINGDMALMQLLARGLIQRDALDRDFLDQHCQGFEEYRSHILAQNEDELLRVCGLSRSQVDGALDLLASSKRVIACWAMGLTQHKNAVATIREVVNVLLLGGNMGREGAGACPVRGHSNVQGDRTVGIWERPSEEFLQGMDREFGFRSPREHGLDVVHTLEAMGKDEIDVFMTMGGNLLSAGPDTDFIQEGLQRVGLTVHVATKLNRTHVFAGQESLILPCLGRSEEDIQDGVAQFVSVENSMGIVHSSQGRLKPSSTELRSEVSIVCGLGQRLFPELGWTEWSRDYSRIRDSIERTLPGFKDYNKRVAESFYLPNPVRDGREFRTESGRAQFSVESVEEVEVGDQELLLMTFRSHDQYNTTIYGMDDRYRGVYGGRRVLLMSPLDMKKRGLDQRQRVGLVSSYGGKERRAGHFEVVGYDLPPGCVGAYFPETNPLVPREEYAHKSHTPISKSVVVRLEV